MNRVLIVEDKEENLYYLSALLTGHGYRVETAHHGAEALVKARQNPPDLIISDLLMPVMDGYTLLRQWKTDPGLCSIPFVVYTATYTEAQDERLALDLGADAFILKPSEPEFFIARLREIEAQGKTKSPNGLRNPEGDEKALFKSYSETLIRKLEKKTLQLEEVNLILEQELAERRKAEAIQRQMAETQISILNALPAHIALVDAEGTIVSVNEAWRRFARANVLEGENFCVGRNYLEVCEQARGVCSEEAAETAVGLRRVLRGEANEFSIEYPCHSTTEKRWFRLMVTPLDEKERAGAVVMHVNVTERKEIEGHFLRAQRMESIGNLAGGMAHDFNNLLAPIVMGIDFIKHCEPDDTILSILRTMEDSAKRGTGLVQQVLSFARGADGIQVSVRIGDIVGEIESILGHTFPKDIKFERKIEKGLWSILGDPTQVNQVILNLCVNARDAMDSGGRLTVSARNVEIDHSFSSTNPDMPTGRYVLLEVADEGCGMPEELVQRVFEPFFTTKAAGKGTGLGLSTVVKIVKNHGGFVDVSSEVGKGSVFRVYFPAQTFDQDSAYAEVKVENLPRGNGELILVVDDEASIRNISTQTLEAFGYTVMVADDGNQALGIYAQHQTAISLVLTDMMMPAMDGVALSRALRAINPDVRIIAVSGEDKAKGAGVRHFLPKPFSARQMLILIKTVLSS